MNCLPFLMSKKWEAVHYMVELILKGRDYFAQRRTILAMLYAFFTARYSQSPGQ